MGKPRKKDADNREGEAEEENLEKRERKRLRELAFSREIISRERRKPSVSLQPSASLVKHDGRDITVKKTCAKKTKYLFAFPCLLAPLSGGRMGELRDLHTQNPVLYVDFPEGRMKMFGTIIHSSNTYLALSFPAGRSSGSISCEDSFQSMVVFSDVWWIGTKDRNPQEAKLRFPKHGVGQRIDPSGYDFNGGISARLDAPNPSIRSVKRRKLSGLDTPAEHVIDARNSPPDEETVTVPGHNPRKRSRAEVSKASAPSTKSGDNIRTGGGSKRVPKPADDDDDDFDDRL